MYELRDYQRQCIDSVQGAFDDNKRRVAIVLPTGAGKTVVLSHLTHEWRAVNRGKRVLILVHRDELVTQTVEKLKSVDQFSRVGVVKGKRNEVLKDIIVASVQSLRNDRRLDLLESIGLVIIDECHRSSGASYIKVLEHLKAWDDDGVKVLGVTATLSRSDTKGLGDIYTDVVFHRDLPWMIHNHYLVDITGHRVVVDLDLDDVKKSRGDYSDSDLAIKLCTDQIREEICRAYLTYAVDRPGIVFAPTVHGAQFFAEGLNAVGIRTETVTGATAPDARRAMYERVRTGVTQVLCSVMVLTEGFDLPAISCVVIARPTLHAGTYVQMVGRALRLSPQTGKKDAVLLDITGASSRHELATIADLSLSRVVPRDGESLMDAELREEDEEGVESVRFDPEHQNVRFEQAKLIESRTKLKIPRQNYHFVSDNGYHWQAFAQGGGGHSPLFFFCAPTEKHDWIVYRATDGTDIVIIASDLNESYAQVRLDEAIKDHAQSSHCHPMYNPAGSWRRQEVSAMQWNSLSHMDDDTLSRITKKGQASDVQMINRYHDRAEKLFETYAQYL